LLLAELAPQIAIYKKAATGDLQVTIAADRSAPHGAVIDVIDVLRREGVLNLALWPKNQAYLL
ncbi:ExbD/TolR family protein, partial [Klebsiella pneumoniae]